MTNRPPRLVPAGLALTLLLAACAGGGSPSAGAPSAGAPSAAAPSSAASEMPSAPQSEVPSGSPSEPASSASAGPPAEADITVTAVDFAFEGVPAEIPAGTTLGLTNTGQEVHEMIVVRKLPTTTQSFEDLLAMPEDQVTGLVEDVGFAFAEPGQSAGDVVTLDGPGDYLMICFIPAGTTSLPSMDPNASGPPDLGTGAPHFTLGMQQEFTVTE